MSENNKAMAVRESVGSQEIVAGPVGYTRQQVELLKRTIARDASDDELQLFVNQATRMGLDPFAKQIHFIKRGAGADAKGTIQVAIDGYRLIADRTGKYAGNDDPIFEGDQDGHPLLARVTVWKLVQGQRCPFTVTARWAEYVPQGNQGFMWRRMPYVMLGKVAEALALRKAFPAELSGTYVDAEMDQADAEPAARPIERVFAADPQPAAAPSQPPQVLGPTRPRSDTPKQPTQPLAGTVDCENCQKPITGQKLSVKGVARFVNAKTIQASTFERTGLTLCWPCYEAAKEPNVVAGEVSGSEAVAEAGDEF
jgi:phage recombination protein Bet